MEEKKRTIALVLLAGISLAILGSGMLEDENNSKRCMNATFESGAELNLAVADNESERRRGLMQRDSLPESSGMIFVYEGEDIRRFWMKNTSIPLDLVYLDSEKVVVDTESMDPEPGVPEDELQIYRSSEDAMYAIETSQGFLDSESVREGQVVSLERTRACPF